MEQFHWLLVVGLGITWVLDGLEVTLMGAISAVLQRPDVLHFTGAQIGAISSSYLAGAVIGFVDCRPFDGSLRAGSKKLSPFYTVLWPD